jgi:SMC interacting uncharacterized protein involved in chromosome segregation
VQRLKEELAEAKSNLAQAVLPGVPEAGDKAKSLKALIDERTSEGPEENSEMFATADKALLAKEDQEDLVVSLDVEINEIEESLVDLREKVGFDCFSSSQLCQSFLVKIMFPFLLS